MVALWGLAIVGCRTHTVDDCRPACNADDQTFFAHCVASGSASDACQAGNRRCCALAADCIGNLDDQTVVSTISGCMDFVSDTCFRPCDTVMDPQLYQSCLTSGAGACAAGNESCCALARDCLGSLGDVIVSADGCCGTDLDCPSGLHCNTSTWICGGAAASCGDGVISSTEQCDDHNTITESCVYGAMSCPVCDASCHSVQGVTHFCGDNTIDLSDGETCDPPEALICDSSCHALQPASCTNGVMDATESDVDCGGRLCAACLAGEHCVVPSDCRPAHPECGATSDCQITPNSQCVDFNSACDDGNACTDDACNPATGACTTHTQIDRDRDGDGPIGCGSDCNDRNAHVSGLLPEACGDNVDNDCDEAIDEGCM